MSKKRSDLLNRSGNIPVRWNEQRERWELSFFSDGKRQRKYFREEKQAQEEWQRVCSIAEKHGITASSYSTADHREFLEAKRIVDGLDLRDVARAYVQNFHIPGKALVFTDAVEEFLAAKQQRKIAPRYLAMLKSHLKHFAGHFAEHSVNAIPSNQILQWLLALRLEPLTVKNYYVSLSVFFNWCQRRKLVANAPTKDIALDDLPIIPKKAKGTLTLEQTRGMLGWLEQHRPHFVAWHIVQLFAGLRNGEASRFHSDFIDFEERSIKLPGWVFEDNGEAKRMTKTKDAWALHGLPDNLWPWLEKYRFKGPIRAPANAALMRMRKAFRELEPPISPWPDNAMRHTFCTMLISLHQDAAKVATWSRHTNARQLFDSYVTSLVSPSVAQRYCEILPAD